MQILKSIPELHQIPGPIVLAIGVFDGLHLGHQAVLQAAKLEASKVGGIAIPLTFNPHPARIVRPQQAPLLLTHTQHKARLLDSLGFSHALVLPFDSALAATEPSDFIRSLASAAQPLHAICVGYDWSFGKGRAGNLALLQKLGEPLNFKAIGVDAVEWKQEPISSTRVRVCIADGDFQSAQAMLGRPFEVLGEVVHGKQLGRTIGFPTANLSLFSEQLPPMGVYAVRVESNGKVFSGVANLGVRPTVDENSSSPSLEVHLLNFGDDLYGEILSVEFIKFLRPEQRFTSIDALKAQIGQDSQQAHAILQNAAVAAYQSADHSILQ